MRGIPHLAAMDALAIRTLTAHARARPTPNHVLEIGCGPGRATAKLLKGVPDIHLHALDNEPRMIRTARRTLARAIKQNRLTLFQADALAFLKSAPAASYDAVISVLCLHNFEAPCAPCLRSAFAVPPLSTGTTSTPP